MSDKYSKKRYVEILHSGGFPRRIYADVPENLRNALKELAYENDIPMSAMLSLLIADAAGYKAADGKASKRKPTPKRTVKKSTTKRKARAKKSSKK